MYNWTSQSEPQTTSTPPASICVYVYMRRMSYCIFSFVDTKWLPFASVLNFNFRKLGQLIKQNEDNSATLPAINVMCCAIRSESHPTMHLVLM